MIGFLVIVGIVVVARHRSSAPAPRPVEHRWDVIGTVAGVVRAPGYHTEPEAIVTTGAPEISSGPSAGSLFTVGPERIDLVGGKVLVLPAGTPGANACIDLMTDADKLDLTGLPAPEGLRDAGVRNYGAVRGQCVVVAALDAHGRVARFSVLDTAGNEKSGTHPGLANAGGIAARSGDRYLTSSGYSFPLDRHVWGSCSPDQVSVSRLRHRPNNAYVDPRVGTIVEVDCLGMA
jgi:hypothetical protein